MRSRTLTLLATLVLASLTLAGCHDDTADDARSYAELGFDGETWPRLDGITITVLHHGDFAAFDDAAARFHELTGARVEEVAANDAGGAVNRLLLEAGDPTFDIVYGIDNVLLSRAGGATLPYTPLLAERVPEQYVFFDAETWPATPVDHGYVAVNWDPRHAALDNTTLVTLDDVAAHADLFVTQDPRTSSPGLGYLLATIATYGETGEFTWKDHWTALFEGGVLVTSGWSEAYENHFSGGYGADIGGQADRPIATSYSTSPAYEAYFERPADRLAEVITAPGSTFHQIQTMAIARGTPHLAAAQAWIEFILTDGYQSLIAANMAVYPVVADVSTDAVFGDHDPVPGSFEPADLDSATIGTELARWVSDWTDLCEAHDCA